jgi:hypothetical protein
MEYNEVDCFNGPSSYPSLQQVWWSPFGMREYIFDSLYRIIPFFTSRYSPSPLCCLWMGTFAPNAGRNLAAGKIGTDTFCRAISRVRSIVRTRLVLGGEIVRTFSRSTGPHISAAQCPSVQITRYIPRKGFLTGSPTAKSPPMSLQIMQFHLPKKRPGR